MERGSWAVAEVPSDRRARRNSRKPVAEFIMLDFEGLRFAEPIDKLDSGIEKTNGTEALATLPGGRSRQPRFASWGDFGSI
jgi:hypothetical protein